MFKSPEIKYVRSSVERLKKLSSAIPEIAEACECIENPKRTEEYRAEQRRLVEIANDKFPLALTAIYNSLEGQQTIILALARKDKEWTIAGFSGIQRHGRIPTARRDAVDYMLTLGNNIYEQRYWDLNIISVLPKFQGQGISKELVKKSVDFIIDNHEKNNRPGPVLIKASEFLPMGKERLLNQLQGIATEHASKMILCYSEVDWEELGGYFNPLDTITLDKAMVPG